MDDTNCVIEATPEYIENTLSIFRDMGNASGLFIKEQGIKAVFISPRPLPPILFYLDWVWEFGLNISKLLGFYIGTGLSSELMSQHLDTVLEDRLQKAKLQHHTLVTHGAVWLWLTSW